MALVVWQSTPLERPSMNTICVVWMWMESTMSEKQKGTHGGCCGCEVAHCGSSTPSKHPSSGAPQNNTTHHTCLDFSTNEITHWKKGNSGCVSEETAKTVFEGWKGVFWEGRRATLFTPLSLCLSSCGSYTGVSYAFVEYLWCFIVNRQHHGYHAPLNNCVCACVLCFDGQKSWHNNQNPSFLFNYKCELLAVAQSHAFQPTPFFRRVGAYCSIAFGLLLVEGIKLGGIKRESLDSGKMWRWCGIMGIEGNSTLKGTFQTRHSLLRGAARLVLPQPSALSFLSGRESHLVRRPLNLCPSEHVSSMVCFWWESRALFDMETIWT